MRTLAGFLVLALAMHAQAEEPKYYAYPLSADRVLSLQLLDQPMWSGTYRVSVTHNGIPEPLAMEELDSDKKLVAAEEPILGQSGEPTFETKTRRLLTGGRFGTDFFCEQEQQLHSFIQNGSMRHRLALLWQKCWAMDFETGEERITLHWVRPSN